MKTCFRDNGCPKRSTQWANFWSGLFSPAFDYIEAPNSVAPRWRPRPFSRQKYDFFQTSIKIMISHNQSIDNSLLSYQKKSARLDKKWPSYNQKRMPIYGIIDILRAILAHNLTKYQYFSIIPGLFDK